MEAKSFEKKIKIMEMAIKAQSKLLACYRTNKNPPEWVFDAVKKARGIGIEI